MATDIRMEEGFTIEAEGILRAAELAVATIGCVERETEACESEELGRIRRKEESKDIYSP